MATPAMYPGKVNSPTTEISITITATSTAITLANASVLPAPPNLAVLGDDETAETVLYTGKTGNTITGVTRGFQGTAKAWPSTTSVARRFTAYDYDTIRAVIQDLINTKGDIHQSLNLFPAGGGGAHAPYGFYIIEGMRDTVPFTEIWIMVNAWYDYDTKRFKRYDINNFSFGWQWQGGGTYPGEGSIGDFINQGMNLWKANGRKAYSESDPAYAQTGEDIGAYQEDGSWREFGIMLGWNNHFMLDSYGGMTIGGAGFEIDGSGTSPFKRTSLGKFTGGSQIASRPYTEYGYAYNGTCWNTQHGLWNKDEDQLAGYFYGLVSPVDFYDQGPTINPGSGRASMTTADFVVRRLGGYVRPYVENWQDAMSVNENGVATFNHWEVLQTFTKDNFTAVGLNEIVIPFPDGTWNKDNTVITNLVGVIGGKDTMLKDREHRWVAGGLRVVLGNTNYTVVKYAINKVAKYAATLHPKNGLTIGNGKKVSSTAKVTATVTSGVYATASYPDSSYNADNCYVVAIKCVVAGVTKQINAASINFTDTNISCVLPEAASSCTFLIQNY